MFRLASTLESGGSLDDPAVWDSLTGGSTATSGVKVTHAKALGYPPLWRALNLIAGDVSKMPLTLYERMSDNGKQKAIDHPAYKLTTREASPIVTANRFRKTVTFHAGFHGNGFAVINRDAYGDPVEKLILDPLSTTAAIANGELWYVTWINGDPVKLPAKDVFHIRGLCNDGIMGFDAFSLMTDALGLGLAAREYGSRFFKDGSNAAGVLMIPGHFDDEKVKHTIKAWDSMVSGITKAHKVALLQDGAKYQQITIDAEKAQLLQTRQFEVREVANIFGVPRHKLGDDTTTSHNSLESENQSYIDECLDPWLVEWEKECNAKLLTREQRESESHFFEFNRNALVRTDFATRIEGYSKQFMMGLSINDWLRMENRPTIGPVGDKRYRPANLVEITDEQPTMDSVRELVFSQCSRLVKIDHDQAQVVISSGKDRSEWSDRFYSSHLQKMRDGLVPAIKVLESMHPEVNAAQHVATVVDAYHKNSLAYLQSDSFPSVEARASGLTDDLMNWKD